jgi:hypothetical protein
LGFLLLAFKILSLLRLGEILKRGNDALAELVRNASDVLLFCFFFGDGGDITSRALDEKSGGECSLSSKFTSILSKLSDRGLSCVIDIEGENSA